MGTKTLHNIAEVKLHLRNQHREKKTAQRIHKIFEQRATPAPPPPVAVNPPNPSPTMEIDPELQEPASDSDSESDMEDDDGDDLVDHGGFNEAMDRHIDMLQDDDDDPFEPAASSAGWERCTISALFDFSRTHWKTLYSKTALRSFDEELKVYELLDLDAQGEDDDDAVDVDDVTGDILIG